MYSDFGYKGSYCSPEPMGGMFGFERILHEFGELGLSWARPCLKDTNHCLPAIDLLSPTFIRILSIRAATVHLSRWAECSDRSNLDLDSENLKNINSINVFKDAGRIGNILKDFTNICRLIWKNKLDLQAFNYYLLELSFIFKTTKRTSCN